MCEEGLSGQNRKEGKQVAELVGEIKQDLDNITQDLENPETYLALVRGNFLEVHSHEIVTKIPFDGKKFSLGEGGSLIQSTDKESMIELGLLINTWKQITYDKTGVFEQDGWDRGIDFDQDWNPLDMTVVGSIRDLKIYDKSYINKGALLQTNLIALLSDVQKQQLEYSEEIRKPLIERIILQLQNTYASGPCAPKEIDEALAKYPSYIKYFKTPSRWHSDPGYRVFAFFFIMGIFIMIFKNQF